MADASPRDCTPGPPSALSPRCPRCSKLCMQPELAFCGGIYIEFVRIILEGLAYRILARTHNLVPARTSCGLSESQNVLKTAGVSDTPCCVQVAGVARS